MGRALAGLYYPFSRCVHPASLKQMLLVFDEITFVDPVDDALWRAKLFEDLELYYDGFAAYQDVYAALPVLIEQGCIKRVDPSFRIDQRSLATTSALADLADPEWVQEACRPVKYGMPSIPLSGQNSWQAFKPKLPFGFLEALQRQNDFQPHLLAEGDDLSSWSLSYAAGSAISISLHLEIAEELNLAPVTDSRMHNRLMLMKAGRSLRAVTSNGPIPDSVVRNLAVELASDLLSQVLSEEQLEHATFEEIIHFREHTAPLRMHFINDLELRLGQLRSIPTPQEWVVAARQVLSALQIELRKYEADFAAGRVKIWPGVLKATTSGVTAGSVAAVGFSLIPSPYALLLGGLTGLAVGAAAAGLEWTAERLKLEKAAAPAVAYLSTVHKRWV